MNYRPDDWYEETKPLLANQGIIPPQTEYPIVISSEFEWEVLKRNCFEAGADAMLGEVLKLVDNPKLVPKRVADDIKLFMGSVK